MATKKGNAQAVYNSAGISLSDGDETGLFVNSTGQLLTSASLTVGTGPTDLGKAEDSAHATGDTGIATWGVANEAQTTLAADGDYIGEAHDTKGNSMTVGNVAAGVADAGAPVKVGGVFNSTQPTYTNGQGGDLQVNSRGEVKVTVTNAGNSAAVSTSFADASSNTVSALATAAYSKIYNGSTWDAGRTVANATNSTGTGIIAAGLVAQLDDTSPTAITENQFGNVRMNSARALYHENGPYVLGRATADTQIKGSAGFIHTISIAALTATPTAGLLSVYDSLTETGTVIYSEWVQTTVTGHTIILDLPASTGIYVGFDATLANVQATLSYR